MSADLTEKLVGVHGERYRKLIESMFTWLDENEPLWELDDPLDREGMVAEAISHIAETP